MTFMNQTHFQTTLQTFEGTTAVLSIEGTNTKVSVPVSNLPSDIQEGETLTLKILNSKAAQDEYQNVARRMLEEMIN